MKNRSNEIRSNEIRIRRELPVRLQVRCYSLELQNGHVLEVLYLFTPRCMYCRSVQFSLITLHGVSVLHRVRVLRHQETLTCLHENEAFFFSF